MPPQEHRLTGDGRAYAVLALALACLALVGWHAFATSVDTGFDNAGYASGLCLGVALMLSVFAGAAATASVLLHAAGRHLAAVESAPADVR